MIGEIEYGRHQHLALDNRAADHVAWIRVARGKNTPTTWLFRLVDIASIHSVCEHCGHLDTRHQLLAIGA